MLDEGPEDDDDSDLSADDAHESGEEHETSGEHQALDAPSTEASPESAERREDAEERAAFSLFSWLRRDPPRDAPPAVVPEPAPKRDDSE